MAPGLIPGTGDTLGPGGRGTTHGPCRVAIWLGNRFLPEVTTALTPYDVGLTHEGVRLEGTPLARAQHAVVLTVRHLKNPQQALAWVAAQNAAALPGLGRKLPHYGTYSFLGFA